MGNSWTGTPCLSMNLKKGCSWLVLFMKYSWDFDVTNKYFILLFIILLSKGVNSVFKIVGVFQLARAICS